MIADALIKQISTLAKNISLSQLNSLLLLQFFFAIISIFPTLIILRYFYPGLLYFFAITINIEPLLLLIFTFLIIHFVKVRFLLQFISNFVIWFHLTILVKLTLHQLRVRSMQNQFLVPSSLLFFLCKCALKFGFIIWIITQRSYSSLMLDLLGREYASNDWFLILFSLKIFLLLRI